jgi:hypothetical protein
MTQAATKRSGLKQAVIALALAAVAVPLAAVPASAATSSARALQLAQAGMLSAVDLPGWTVVSSGSGLNEGSGSAPSDGFTCSGIKTVPMLAGSKSEFSNGASLVITGASVASSSAVAKSAFKSAKSARVLSCLKQHWQSSLKTDGITSISVDRATAKVAGADDSTALRVTFKGKMHGVKVTLDEYFVQERVGQTEITVMTQKVNSGFPSLKKAISYAHTLAKRVGAV